MPLTVLQLMHDKNKKSRDYIELFLQGKLMTLMSHLWFRMYTYEKGRSAGGSIETEMWLLLS